jgi:diguanylate cyclase
MELHYDIWLVLLSLTASSFAAFVTFSFVNRLYHTNATSRHVLLPIYSIAVGGGLWGVHFVNWLSFHNENAFQLSTPELLASMFAAIVVGFVICYTSSKKIMPFRQLITSGLIAGLCSYVMFYMFAIALYAFTNVAIDPISLLIALILAIIVSMLGMLSLSWMKEYVGENSLLVRVILSLVIAATLIGLHITFSASIFLQNISSTTANIVLTDKKLLAAIIALSVACLFLMVFAVAMFYEKAGKNLFKLNILNRKKNLDASVFEAKDALTNLSNRRAFLHQLETAAGRCERTGNTLAVAYIDLDHFKPINDNFGHHVGDAVLTTVAQRLQAAVRGCDTVARLGGDEFVALIEEIKSDQDIIPIVDRIVQSIKDPFTVNHHQIEISCSVGIAIYPRDGNTEKLLICADTAMYKAKENGKNQFRFYDAEIEFAADQMQEMYGDLQVALEQNQFKLVYQPKFDCQTHLAVGAEALVRWDHPLKGLLSPKDFIAEAERFGYVNAINEWVMEEVCRTIQHAKKDGVDLNVSINLARQQFRNANLVHEVTEVLRRFDVPASNITFEIKETTAIKNEKQFKLLLAQFKLAKIKIALDDFGLHPFTLAYLQELNIDELKLDKLFISKMTRSKPARALVDAVIRLAHALGFNVVAEGVETTEQRNMLAELGCNHMQGYLLSRPVPEDQLFALFKQLSINFESDQMSAYQSEAA